MPTAISDEELFAHAARAKGKVVVITGAAGGIGKQVALAFARHGAKIVIGDLDAAGAEDIVHRIQNDGGEAASMGCDVVNWDDQVALFELAVSRFGVVDVVIPNAGIADDEEVCSGGVKLTDGKLAKPKLLALQVNMNGVFYTAHLGVHYMKRNRTKGDWKALVMIGSMASWIGLPTGQQYTASKHAALGLMRALDPILALEDIRTACIHPWFADTNIVNTGMRLLLAGIPLAPVARIAGAIFRAATDPDMATSGCPWVLLDDGPVLLCEKETLREGVYAMFDARLRRGLSFRATVLFWIAFFRDLGHVFSPVLFFFAVVGPTALLLRS
ncbi:hypothetical protein BC834DRAFT_494233 [Gloeopeniophorella convolvens]|nr:hypothetical protein BC834DRAFT_494233 [Gloeopeniophorella convolvens]